MNAIVVNPASKNAIPWVLGCTIGYFATRIAQWLCRDSGIEKRSLANYLFPIFSQSTQLKDLPAPLAVCIDLITINKIENNQLDYRVSRLSLAEFVGKVSYDELNSLRESVKWGKRTKEIWDKVISNSSYIVCVVKENENTLIANAFFVGNGRMGTILDVAVRPEYQRNHIGTLVMNQMIKHIKAPGQNYAGIGLFADGEDKKKFYAKFGFKENPDGMEAWGSDLYESRKSPQASALNSSSRVIT